MRENYTHKSRYFYGHEISEYGLKNGYIDYRTLAGCFDAVLNNEIMAKTSDQYYWEQENGFIDNSDRIEEIDDRIDEIAEEIEEAEETRDYLDRENARYNKAGNPIVIYAMVDNQSKIKKLSEKLDALEEERQRLEEEKEELEREQDYFPEIFQYFIISDQGAEILKDLTNEIVFYNSDLDMYIWGVTHFGTSWDYVLTDIRIDLTPEEVQ